MSYELEIQKFLRAGNTVQDLIDQYHLHISYHPEYPNLVGFKYDQIASPFSEKLVREARSLILDSNDNFKLICQGFEKFFNHGEGNAATLDWKTTKIQEKVDGSLICLYHYDDKWHAATTGTPGASGNVNDTGKTFSRYFFDTFEATRDIGQVGMFVNNLKTNCYFFELCGLSNKIVVRHAKDHVVALGGRDLITGKEFSAEDTSKIWGVPAVKQFPLMSFEEAEATFKDMDPTQQEGYIFVDANFNRQKHKNPAYVALHHLKSSFSLKNLVDLVRMNKAETMIKELPEYQEIYDDVMARWNTLLDQIEAVYSANKEIVSQKEFAFAVTYYRFSSALFAFRAKKVTSFQHHLQRISINSLMNWLGFDHKQIAEPSEKPKELVE